MLTTTAEFPIAGSATYRRAQRPRRNPLVYLLTIASMLCALRAASLFTNRARHEQDVIIPANVVADFGQRPSHAGLYRAEVTAAAVRVGEPQQWIVRLQRRNGRRVAFAGLRVRVWMPETDIESPMRPTATYIGGGEYRLDRVLFTRPGWWNVALAVDGVSGVDSLAFNVRMP